MVWHLSGVRVLTSPDVRFVIGVDVMFGAPGLVSPMVVDYSGQVTMHVQKKGFVGKYVCHLAVPDRYRRQASQTLPPPPPPPAQPGPPPKGAPKKGVQFSDNDKYYPVPARPD